MGSTTHLVSTKESMKEASVKTNVIANFAGRAWISLMSLLFVPLYIKFMGIESYGLIGIFISIIALFSLLDMGLSSTLSRELARLSATKDSAQESRNLVRTLEVIYWGVGLVIGLVVMLLAPVIAHHWVKTQGIPAKTVQQAVMIMGLVAAIQWPSSLYAGGLMGLQRQVRLNGVWMSMATIQHGGAVLVLWFISPTILAYFTWQIFISIVQTLLLAYSVWKTLPATHNESVFKKDLLQKNWKFAAGMTGITIIATILTQADKVILSKMLTLTVFGYYILAFNIANAVIGLVNPVFSAIFPKLSQLIVEEDNENIVSDYYHKGCQLASIIVFPVAAILAFFSVQVLQVWIRDPVIVQNTHLLLSLLVLGSTFNAVMILPLSLQLAHGWTRLSFIKNVFAVIIYVPLLLWLVGIYGATGAAIVWIILNVGYFLIEIPIMHNRLLVNDMWRWYFKDVGIPILIAFCVVGLSRILLPHNGSSFLVLSWITFTGMTAFSFTAMAFPFTYEWLRRVKNI